MVRIHTHTKLGRGGEVGGVDGCEAGGVKWRVVKWWLCESNQPHNTRVEKESQEPKKKKKRGEEKKMIRVAMMCALLGNVKKCGTWNVSRVIKLLAICRCTELMNQTKHMLNIRRNLDNNSSPLRIKQIGAKRFETIIFCKNLIIYNLERFRV